MSDDELENKEQQGDETAPDEAAASEQEGLGTSSEDDASTPAARGFYKGSGAAYTRSSKRKRKVAIALFGSGGLAIITIVVLMMAFVGSFKSVHYATVLRSVGFARFNMYMDRQFSQAIFDAATLTDASTGTFHLDERGLLDKLRRINPEKQLATLGREGTLKFDFEGDSKWGGLKTQSNFKGVEINGQKVNLDDIATKFGYDSFDAIPVTDFRARLGVRAEFVNSVRSGLADRLALEGRAFRGSVFDGLRQAAGIRMWKWLNKAREFVGKTPDEARKLEVQETNKEIQSESGTVKSGNSEVDEAASELHDAEIAAAEAGEPAPTPGELRSSFAKRAETLSDVSFGVFLSTTACIVHDLSNSFATADRQRQIQAAREGHDIQTTGSQVMHADTSAEAVGADASRWDGADAAVLYKEDTGQTVTDFDKKQLQDIPDIRSPGSLFKNVIDPVNGVLNLMTGGPVVDALSGIPGFGGLVHAGRDKIINTACNVLLNPATQGAIAVAEIASAVSGAQELGQAVKIGLESSLKLAGTVGVGEVLGKLIENTIKNYAGSDFSGLASGPSLYNEGHVTTDYLQQTGTRQITYGAPMSADDTVKSQALALADLHNKFDQGSWKQRYFAVDNPFSLVGRMSAIMPGGLSDGVASFQRNLASLPSLVLSIFQQTAHVFGNLFMPKQAAYAAGSSVLAEQGFNGVEEWGWTNEELQKISNDSSYAWENLANYVEPRLDSLNKAYDDCYGYELQIDKPDKCTASYLTTDAALKWRAYMAESYAADRSSEDLNVAPTGSTPGTTNIVAGDTSNLTCNAGSDTGVGDGYQDGKLYKIRLCNVQGIIVNAQIAVNVDNLLNAAHAAGIPLAGSGFRTMAQQQALRDAHGCSSPSLPSSACHPPTARPGYSNHQMGLAIDFNNCTTHSSACWQWLNVNAGTYHLFNLASEPWHWSVDGH